MQEQYAFIHDAALEFLICGETQIPASDLRLTVEKLSQTDKKTGKSEYETEFHVSMFGDDIAFLLQSPRVCMTYTTSTTVTFASAS